MGKSNKTWLSVVLSICLVVQMFLGLNMQHAAAAEPAGNLIPNAGFEDTTDNIPAHWTVMGNVWKEGISAEGIAARTGNYGIKIQTSLENNPWVAIPVPVEEGAMYEVTSWFKAVNVTGGTPGYKIEFFKGIDKNDDNWITGYVYQATSADNDTQWHELKYEIEAPPESKYMYVYLRLYAKGSVYFDDVSVVKAKDRSQINVNASQRFYYTDVTEGNVRLKLIPVDDTLSGKTVDVRIVNEATDGVLFTQSDIPAATQMNIPFDTTGMDYEQSYRIEATFKDAGGQLIEQGNLTIYRWERPTTLPQNGPIMVDGEPFFPVFAYHAEQSDYPLLKSIGVNTVQGGNASSLGELEAMLDNAHQNGLKVLVALYNNMRVKENFAQNEYFVREIKDHPAVLGYMVMDEPTSNGVALSELVDAYKLIRSIDPDHPVYMVEDLLEFYGQTGQVTDMLVTDVYPLRQTGNLPLRSIGESVRHAVESVSDLKPVWTILQTFKYRGTFWTVLANEDQFRNMAYQAFLSGAKALGYYAINDPGWRLWDSELFPIMAKFKEELVLIGNLVTGGTKTVSHLDNNVQWAVYNKGQEQYAIALNLTQEAQTVMIPLAQAGNEIELLYGDLPGKAGSWEQQLAVKLKPEQTLVYRIKPFVVGVDQAIDTLEDARALATDNEWENGVQGLVTQLQQLRGQLAVQPVSIGQAMGSAAAVLGDIADLKSWVNGKPDPELLNVALDQVTVNLLPILQAAASLELQVDPVSLLAGDELELNVNVRNVGNQTISNVQLRIELPAEMELAPIEHSLGNIGVEDSAYHRINPGIPANMQPGKYAVKVIIHYEYAGTDIRISTERSFAVTPLLTAKLIPGNIDIMGPGTYPFSVELRNGSGQPLEVELPRQTVSGITVDLVSSVTLAGYEKRTIQGNVTTPEDMNQGEHVVTIGAESGGTRYETLSLRIFAETNTVYNGGFEKYGASLTMAEGWDMRAGMRDATVSRTGQASVMLTPDSNDTWNVVNTDSAHIFEILPGSRYKLTGWVKTAATAGSVALGIRQIDGTGSSVDYLWSEAGKTGDWEKVEVIFETLPSATYAAVYFKMDTAANAAAWLDDVELEELPEVIEDSGPVRNAGFEKKDPGDNGPEGWSLYKAVWDNTVSHSGQYSVRHDPDPADAWNVMNTHAWWPIEVTSGKTYVLSGWVKNNATAGSVALGVREVNESGGSVNYTWTDAAPDSDWTKVNVEFTAQPDTRTIWIYFKIDQAANGSAWLDDLELQEVIEDSGPVRNAGFEKKDPGDNGPEGWSLYKAVWDNTVSHSGQYSVRHDPDPADAWNVMNTHAWWPIEVTSGKTYVLSGWVKNNATAGSVALGVREVNESGGSVNYTWTDAAPDSDWTKVNVEFTAQPDTRTIWIFFKIDQAANGSAWLDDLELKEIVTALEANLSVSNIEASEAGIYPFAVELTNDSNIPVTVDLPRDVPDGLTLTLAEQVTLAAGETKTVQGTVEVSASTADDEYSVTIEAKVGSVSYAALPLAVNVHMTAIEADLTPGSIEVSQAGTTYPFAVELTNNSGSNFPVTVDLLQDVPDGLTLTLAEQVTLAAGETKTVQGTVEVSASAADDEYSVTIEAKVGSVSYAALPLAVNVHVLKIERIELSGLTSPMTVGAKANSVVTAVYNYGSPVEVTVSAEYDSSNPEVATVSEAGEVTAVSAGSTVITATYGGHTADFNLTVASLPDTNQNTGITTGTTTPEPETDVVTVGQDQVKPDNNGNVVLTLPEGKKSLAIPVEVLKLLADTGLEVAGGAVGITIPKETIQAHLAQLGGEGSVTFRLDRLSDTDAVKRLGKLDKPGNVQLQSAGDTIDVRASLVGKDGNSTAAVLSNQRMALKLKIAPGVDPRLVGIYLIHDDGTLEFIEGKRNGDRMEAEITSPGKYTLLVFDKHYMDVKEGHWAADSIRVLTARHIVNGVTETDFAPQREITRAEFAALLVRALNLKAGGTPAGFADVADSQWFARDVAAAKEAGLINGTNHGSFAPNQTITREEMAVMLVRAWELISGNRKHAGNIAPVGDVGQASAWAQASIQYALEQDLLKGRADGRFDPKKSTSRAESAQAIYNLLQLKDEL